MPSSKMWHFEVMAGTNSLTIIRNGKPITNKKGGKELGIIKWLGVPQTSVTCALAEKFINQAIQVY